MSKTPPRPRGSTSLLARLSRAGLVAAVCAGAVAVGACSSTPKAIPENAPAYPGEAAGQAKILNVQVLRSGPSITFTNTTAGPLGPCRMWLNQRFSRMIDKIEVGQTVTLDLYSFTDEFGDEFRGGGFFSMERPDKVVLSQLEIQGADGTASLLGLITIAGGEDD